MFKYKSVHHYPLIILLEDKLIYNMILEKSILLLLKEEVLEKKLSSISSVA